MKPEVGSIIKYQNKGGFSAYKVVQLLGLHGIEFVDVHNNRWRGSTSYCVVIAHERDKLDWESLEILANL